MIVTRFIRWTAFALAFGSASFGVALAEDSMTLNISLKDNQFQPAELHAPANKPIVIVLKNLNSTPAEFESQKLRVEKVVTGGGTISMRIRPLEPGRYRFFNDFHKEAQGYLIVP
jgi:hypothetical protein